jgi:hypothetical protein
MEKTGQCNYDINIHIASKPFWTIELNNKKRSSCRTQKGSEAYLYIVDCAQAKKKNFTCRICLCWSRNSAARCHALSLLLMSPLKAIVNVSQSEGRLSQTRGRYTLCRGKVVEKGRVSGSKPFDSYIDQRMSLSRRPIALWAIGCMAMLCPCIIRVSIPAFVLSPLTGHVFQLLPQPPPWPFGTKLPHLELQTLRCLKLSVQVGSMHVYPPIPLIPPFLVQRAGHWYVR